MSNKSKELDIKNRTYCFLDEMINTKNLDPNKIKIDEKSYRNICVYHIGYMMVKVLSYVIINSVNLLYLYKMGTLKKVMEINN